ncbi:heme peroxidase family protein [Stachybotrys elegans]|uniref:Heme peroxidase family protein n=1 Tax=Stachybotrys elegans TaxID=80388 RepID=A0A8K0WVM2_9HYPO|nr:heme peroxidase family protein [Stachybotrys elegans]
MSTATAETNHAGSAQANLANLLHEARRDVLSQVGRILPDMQLIHNAADTALASGVIDDRQYLVEGIIQLATSLPNGSKLRDDLNAAFIGRLWNNLLHPPLSYLGDKFRYRTADGSNNNILYPQLGAAGSHYARSVLPKHERNVILPDPVLIFDNLMARKDPCKESPSQVSSSLFYLATIIIHDLFHTDERDQNKLRTSSYLDLSPLYGKNAEEQAKVRTFKNGLLKNDVFAENRLLTQPPGVGALMVAFNRFHNYMVGELAAINEDGRFSIAEEPGHPDYEEKLLKRDNDLFQTGRLVTCGLYVNMILSDYLRTILNLNRNPNPSDWKLDPREDFNDVFDAHGVPQGVGNQVSVEFNMIYRWHSAVSSQDESWANGFFQKIFPGDDPETISVEKFMEGLRDWARKEQPTDPEKWTFGDLVRDKDGTFSDSELVKLLQEGTDNVSGKYFRNARDRWAFGARNVPRVFRALEIYGIQQGREWGLATLNEFRQFFKLKPYRTFAELNPDPEVAKALEALYGHPDNVEMYPGIVCEEAKKPIVPGSGLCPGFTTSFAILSDAVALVRGDRFYTVDYGPSSLTSFGYTQISSNFDVAGGGVMYKLLMRAFPGWYRSNSIYALYPFTTPTANRETFETLGTAHTFDFNKPSFIGPPTPIITWEGVTNVLKDQENFHVPWGDHTFQLTGHGYMLSGDTPNDKKQREFVETCLYSPKTGLDEVRQFYESITSKLFQDKSLPLRGSYQVDIVKDIGRLAHAHFVSRFFAIPLQEYGAGPNAYTAGDLSEDLSELFGYVFLDLDTVESYKNRVVATAKATRLGERMKVEVGKVEVEKAGSHFLPSLRHLLGPVYSDSRLKSYGVELVKRLLGDGNGVDEATWTIIPTAAAACATQAQGWAQMIDLYLSDKYYAHWPAIQKLAKSDDPEAFEKLKKYALEGFRLSTPAFGLLRTVVADKIMVQDGPRAVPVKKGDSIFTDFVTAGVDSSKFPDPYEIKLDRADDLYIHHGWGPHSCLGRQIVTTAAASMLRVCALQDNLRRAPGPAGEMKSKTVNGAFKMYLAENGSGWGVFPVCE